MGPVWLNSWGKMLAGGPARMIAFQAGDVAEIAFYWSRSVGSIAVIAARSVTGESLLSSALFLDK